MVISIPVKDRQTVSENTTSNQESGEATQKMYEEYVEKRLEDTLSDVEGAGKVKVMVSLKNSSEKILAKDTDYSDEEVKYSLSLKNKELSLKKISNNKIMLSFDYKLNDLSCKNGNCNINYINEFQNNYWKKLEIN